MMAVTNYWALTRGSLLSLAAGDIYGEVATGTMYDIGAGCRMTVPSPSRLRVGGTLTDIKVAGKTAIFPIDGTTGLAVAPAQTCSIANFANVAIFNGNIFDPLTGTAVLTST